jgi:hypothetical protein
MSTLLAVSPYIGYCARPVVILLVRLGLALGLRRARLAVGAQVAVWVAIAAAFYVAYRGPHWRLVG